MKRTSFLLLSLLVLGLTSGAGGNELIFRAYDVSDLVRKVRDFPAPRLGLQGLDEDASTSFGLNDRHSLRMRGCASRPIAGLTGRNDDGVEDGQADRENVEETRDDHRVRHRRPAKAGAEPRLDGSVS